MSITLKFPTLNGFKKFYDFKITIYAFEKLGDCHCHSNFGNTFCIGETFLLFDIDFIGVKRYEMEKNPSFSCNLWLKLQIHSIMNMYLIKTK